MEMLFVGDKTSLISGRMISPSQCLLEKRAIFANQVMLEDLPTWNGWIDIRECLDTQICDNHIGYLNWTPVFEVME